MRKITPEWQIRIFFGVFLVVLLLFAKTPFNFLILNTILGYIPIELGFHLLKSPSHRSPLFWLLLVVWLLFFPNAPYILTDLFHLALLNPHVGTTGLLKSTPTIWFNFSLLLTSALSCTLLAMNQLLDMATQFRQRRSHGGILVSTGFILLICLLSSVGIYMGRFLRIHSLYMLLTPTWFIKQIFSMWSISMLEFTGLLTLCQLLICWLLIIIRNRQNATRHP